MLDIFGFTDGGSVWDSDDQERGQVIETIPTNNGGQYGDVFDILGKAGTLIGNVATSAGSFISARNSIQLDREKQAFELDQARLKSDLARQQLTGAIDLEKYRTAAEIARSQGAMTMPGLSSLFYGGAPSSGGGVSFNPMGLVVMAAVGYLGYKAFKAA